MTVHQLPAFYSAASRMAKTVLAFDLYGTLLSTESIARELGEHFDQDTAKSVATVWRRYQLEYTWRLNSMGTNPAAHQHSIIIRRGKRY